MEKQSTRKFLKLLIALVALFLLAASALMLASCKEHVHQYELDESKSTNATCNQAGSQTFVCPECGDIYVNVVPATGQHTWQETKVYPASCESEGWTVFTCSVCGTQKQDNWTPKLTHKYEVAETHEATCTTDGYQIFECSFCGDRYTDSQYTAEHPKLGHDYAENTDEEDTASAEDKAAGWVTVKEADCESANSLERTCTRCGEVETKSTQKALGHVLSINGSGETKCTMPCKINPKLMDAEGNRVYAYECARENCPVEVKIDSRGTTKHYIKAVDHKMETVEEVIYCENDEDAGQVSYRKEKCSVCDTKWNVADGGDGTYKVTQLEAAGHSYNTLQQDGKTPVVVCIEDTNIDTLAKYQAFMRTQVSATDYINNAADYEAAWLNAYTEAETAGLTKVAYTDGAGTQHLRISRVCTRCGEPTLATGHDYVIAKFVEGSATEVEKDEDGNIVDYSDEVTVANMTCRYEQICTGCGDVKTRGTHKNVSEATCREGGICPDCGLVVDAQLAHHWIFVGDIISETNWKTNGSKTDLAVDAGFYGQKKPTNKEIYDAYVKVSATETWMTPVEGDCESESTEVHICLDCLMEAAKAESDVTWNQATSYVTLPTTATATNAYVVTKAFNHKYEETYFSLSATSTEEGELEWNETNCRTGYKTAWICSKCGDVLKNVPVANDPTTVGEDKTENDETNEAFKNKAENAAGEFFTDANGFVLKLDESTAKSEKFVAKELEKALKDVVNNFGKHSLYVTAGYEETNGYVAPTCATVGEVPYVCENCGQIVVLAASTKEDDTFAFATEVTDADGKKVEIIEQADITAAEAKDKFNHAGKVYDCGMHCDHKTGLVADCGALEVGKNDHTTITISYVLKSEVKNYYADYSVKIARVGAESKDATKDASIENNLLTLLDGTKIAKCSTTSDGTGLTFTEPKTLSGEFTAPEEGYEDYIVLVNDENEIFAFTGTGTLQYYTEDNASASTVTTGQSVTQNDTYFVNFEAGPNGGATVAPVHASDVTSLEYALAGAPDKVGNEKVLTVELSGNIGTSKAGIDLTAAYKKVKNTEVDRIVFEMNGYTIYTSKAFTVTANEEVDDVVINNGTINYLTADATGNEEAAVLAGNNTTVTLNDVTVVSANVGVRVHDNAKVAMTGVTVRADGAYGVTLPRLDSDSVVTIKDSSIVMNPDNKGVTAAENVSNTALFMASDSVVTVTGSTLSANRQVVVVRAGELNMSGTTLTLAGGYNVAVKANNSDLETYKANSIAGYTTVEDYLRAGRWIKEGNAVPHAALVVGQSNDAANAPYQAKTTVTLSSVTFNVQNDDLKAIVGSKWPTATLTNPAFGYVAANEETGAEAVSPIMVFMNANGCLTENDITLCLERSENTLQLVNCGAISQIW